MGADARRRLGWALVALGGLAVLGHLVASPTPGASEASGAQHSSTTTATTTAGPSTPARPLPSSTHGIPAAARPPAARVLYAVVGVVDGDTLRVRVGGTTERVRLIGVDTPESVKPGTPVQCYAKQATRKMQSLVQSTSVRLVVDPSQADRDTYGRLLRYVDLADGRSVARILITGGFGRELTFAGPYAEQAANRAAETAARKAGAGLWSACPSFGAPLVAVAPKPATTSPASCLIKGNISSSGERIYHLPGQRYYDATIITDSKGERWFCTEAQAVAAGWRKAKV